MLFNLRSVRCSSSKLLFTVELGATCYARSRTGPTEIESWVRGSAADHVDGKIAHSGRLAPSIESDNADQHSKRPGLPVTRSPGRNQGFDSRLLQRGVCREPVSSRENSPGRSTPCLASDAKAF